MGARATQAARGHRPNAMKARLVEAWPACRDCRLEADWNEAACEAHQIAISVERGTWTLWARGVDDEIRRASGASPRLAAIALDD